MKTKQLIKIALRAGELLVRSGAEVYRVEDTILRIFNSYKVKCECFVLLTGIFVSAEDENDENITVIRRIKGYTIDLKRIEKVNAFSRSLQNNPLSYADAVKVLDDIERTTVYSLFHRVAAAGITAFVYTILFKGNYKEALAAMLISIIIYLIGQTLKSIGFFLFFEYFISGLAAGIFSILSTLLFRNIDVYKVIIGAIMILVPGVAMTNGIKDALYGDTISSLYRLAEAIFIAVAVGSGVGIMLTLGFKWI